MTQSCWIVFLVTWDRSVSLSRSFVLVFFLCRVPSFIHVHRHLPFWYWSGAVIFVLLDLVLTLCSVICDLFVVHSISLYYKCFAFSIYPHLPFSVSSDTELYICMHSEAMFEIDCESQYLMQDRDLYMRIIQELDFSDLITIQNTSCCPWINVWQTTPNTQ